MRRLGVMTLAELISAAESCGCEVVELTDLVIKSHEFGEIKSPRFLVNGRHRVYVPSAEDDGLLLDPEFIAGIESRLNIDLANPTVH